MARLSEFSGCTVPYLRNYMRLDEILSMGVDVGRMSVNLSEVRSRSNSVFPFDQLRSSHILTFS